METQLIWTSLSLVYLLYIYYEGNSASWLCTYQFVTWTAPLPPGNPPGILIFPIFGGQIPTPQIQKAVQMPHM